MGKHHTALERTPARVALAEVIGYRDGLKAEHGTLKSAYSVAEDRALEASRALETVKNRLSGVRAAAVEFAIEQAAGRETEPPLSRQKQRELIADAEDELSIQRAARDAIKLRLEDYKQRIGMAESRVTAAAKAVLKQAPSLEVLEAKATVALQAMLDAAEVMAFVFDEHLVASEGTSTRHRWRRMTRDGLQMFPNFWGDLVNNETVPGAKPWRTVLEELTTNPDVALP